MPGLLHLSFNFSAISLGVHYVQGICWPFAFNGVEAGLPLWVANPRGEVLEVITACICVVFIPTIRSDVQSTGRVYHR